MDALMSVLNYTALLAVGLACSHNVGKSREINRKKNRILNCKEEYPLSVQNVAKLEVAKGEGERVAYIEIDRSKSNITPSSFIHRMQSISLMEVQLHDDHILEGVSGNGFDYQFNNNKIRVGMSECNIDRHALDRNVKPIKIEVSPNTFANTNHFNVTYTFQALISLSIFGTLQFNVEDNKFHFHSLFIFPYRSKESAYAWVSNYYNALKSPYVFRGVLLGVIFGFMIPFAYHRLKNDFQKIKNFFTQKGEKRGEKLNRVETRAEDRLKCPCGKNMDFFGDCGHLSMCLECFEKDNHCKICGKVINVPTHIYV